LIKNSFSVSEIFAEGTVPPSHAGSKSMSTSNNPDLINGVLKKSETKDGNISMFLFANVFIMLDFFFGSL